MTVGTLRPLTALMNVIGHVAANALLRRSLVALACVAGGTGHLPMLICEREARLLMIECIFLPRLGVVTGGALSPQCTVMDIVLAMAVDTSRRRLAIRSIRSMASRAGHGYVGIPERKIRQLVREAGLVELVDVGVAALMFRMAAAALTGRRLGHPAVVARLGADIGSDFLVTVQAQRGLALPVGTVVTVTAFAIDLGVGLGDGPGHDERFDACGMRRGGVWRGEQHKQQRRRQGPQAEHAVSLLRSVHVHGNHMHDAGGYQHEK